MQTNIKGIECKNEQGWLEIDASGRIFLNTSCFKGYVWDGCTPKFEILDFLIGTPDGKLDYGTEKPITYFASMTHNLLYQFKKEIPLSRKTVDILFYIILKDSVFFGQDFTTFLFALLVVFYSLVGKQKKKLKV
ncbi:hypothetical protein [uncultured Maribacter sp.]|uniref:hypothetical protein n=1 Tax=uncultured Maribacter sp. TaxID=431308 RepID=UPI0026054F18|nr:hypothetical protein [uncultured Maribacter sp.]